MKIFFLLSGFIYLSNCFAQDVITKKTGEDIQAKILENGIYEYKYILFNNPDTSVKTIFKADVLMVRYQNGKKDIYSGDRRTEYYPDTNYSKALFDKGKEDATRFYHGDDPAVAGTVVTTIVLTPIGGLVPFIACSSVKPKDHNLNAPDLNLIKRKDYHDGYVQRAKSIKNRKLTKFFLISSGIYSVTILSLMFISLAQK